MHNNIRLPNYIINNIESTLCNHGHLQIPINNIINNEPSETIFSLISVKYLGKMSEILSLNNANYYNLNTFPDPFDLSRVNLKLSINLNLTNNINRNLFSKIEVFDYGFIYENSQNHLFFPEERQLNNIVINIPNFINQPQYIVKCKDIIYIIFELLKICIVSKDTKYVKRIVRLFSILHNIFSNNTETLLPILLDTNFYYLKFIDRRQPQGQQ